MGWSTGIEIDEADGHNTGGLKSEDVRAGERFCTFDPCCETVCSRKLSEHDRSRFIDETSSSQAKNWMFTEPIGWQVFFADNGQVFVRRIFRDALYCR